MFQVLWLFGFLDAAVLNEAPVIIVIKRLQGLLHRGIGQEHGFTPWPIVLPMPLADHHCMNRIWREVTPVVVSPVILSPIWLVRH
jgi:hypothetical protein